VRKVRRGKKDDLKKCIEEHLINSLGLPAVKKNPINFG
jgi:hypothetical protein